MWMFCITLSSYEPYLMNLSDDSYHDQKRCFYTIKSVVKSNQIDDDALEKACTAFHRQFWDDFEKESKFPDSLVYYRG